jgi:DNA-binding NarL/FixJ family response regulator
MIRVLIVDGQAEVRRGLRMRLEIEPDMNVVGETGSVDDALALAETLNPDAVVVDVAERGPRGANIIQKLHEVSPAAAIVVLTLHSDEATRAWARAAGAGAFLEKRGGVADLLQALRQLAAHRPEAGGGDGPSPLAKRRTGVG